MFVVREVEWGGDVDALVKMGFENADSAVIGD
jgi:hypothetical protein